MNAASGRPAPHAFQDTVTRHASANALTGRCLLGYSQFGAIGARAIVIFSDNDQAALWLDLRGGEADGPRITTFGRDGLVIDGVISGASAEAKFGLIHQDKASDIAAHMRANDDPEVSLSRRLRLKTTARAAEPTLDGVFRTDRPHHGPRASGDAKTGPAMQSYRAGVALVLLAGVLWSLTGLALRLIPEVGTWQVLFYRSLGMVPVLAAFVHVRSNGQLLVRISAVGRSGIVGGAGLVLAFSGAIYAFQTTTVANAVFLFAASPFFTALLAWLVIGEPVRRATWLAMAVAGAGMALMVREGLAAGALAGNSAALASAFGFAVFSVMLRRGRSGDMVPAVILGGLFALFVGGVAAVVSGQGLSISPFAATVAIMMGAASLAFGMVCYTVGSRVVAATDLVLLSMVEVLLAPVWVWLVFGETASPGMFLGGAVVLAAILGNAMSGARRRPAIHMPVPGPTRTDP